MIFNDPDYTMADKIVSGFLAILVAACALMLLVGVPLGLHYAGIREEKDRSVCEAYGMMMTDIRQGSGKYTSTLHVCRAPNGQLYSF
jgi:hypothetical protein